METVTYTLTLADAVILSGHALVAFAVSYTFVIIRRMMR